ncbi:uncharacterized protein [Apostichopus japonicus]|uniref:uncharacterized protein isoform X2 n=1 Tax=Stichopus japonicus TaxID=307972 RepID=UPI003AB75D82
MVPLKLDSVVINVGCGVRVAIEARHLLYRANTNRATSPVPKSPWKIQKREQPKIQMMNEFGSIAEENAFLTSNRQTGGGGQKDEERRQQNATKKPGMTHGSPTADEE